MNDTLINNHLDSIAMTITHVIIILKERNTEKVYETKVFEVKYSTTRGI